MVHVHGIGKSVHRSVCFIKECFKNVAKCVLYWPLPCSKFTDHPPSSSLSVLGHISFSFLSLRGILFLPFLFWAGFALTIIFTSKLEKLKTWPWPIPFLFLLQWRPIFLLLGGADMRRCDSFFSSYAKEKCESQNNIAFKAFRYLSLRNSGQTGKSHLRGPFYKILDLSKLAKVVSQLIKGPVDSLTGKSLKRR